MSSKRYFNLTQQSFQFDLPRNLAYELEAWSNNKIIKQNNNFGLGIVVGRITIDKVKYQYYITNYTTAFINKFQYYNKSKNNHENLLSHFRLDENSGEIHLIRQIPININLCLLEVVVIFKDKTFDLIKVKH